jgi:hypothetical protein
MKLKVLTYASEEIELKEPLYLYFQGDSGDEELIKIWNDKELIIKTSHYNTTIEISPISAIREWYLDERNKTTTEHFEETLEWAINLLKNNFEN